MELSAFGDSEVWPRQDLIGVSAELDETLVVEAYTCGVFPMPLEEGVIGWFAPMERGVLPLASLRVTRSMRQSQRRYRTTVDVDFDAVVHRCADPTRPYGWIDDRIIEVYTGLHERGLVHSVEVWDEQDRLVGGLYGVSMGGLFAGESMFHDPEHGRDASKVALMRLVRLLSADGRDRLLDVQWRTPHLDSLGAVGLDRARYLRRLAEALAMPEPDWDDG
ncbi:leucyl/phenylalanyl-tRNA--protein transferase [Auraticoccus sp. F435]|uniref:Leucyl/phenylalanyl-tRNA--protein transferase n=1 Tax=Auraticoccus cholistanensis TaxID=2656650 RepID=A0A6A9USV0_9ACTN|nr:leucyl/phenylalanyl-tRNA--protein transferase [Auraticoccus cholistanensis]MVA74805.1 leucyl/phenylalanyl-tRNA--protein transferase [Auraticoccus cholistanensis]